MKKLIHARIDSDDAAKLEKIATKQKRTISWLVSEAVKIFVRKKAA